MSFGFSIGDFIAVIELTNKIRRAFVGAPQHFNAISCEVKSLSIVIQEADIVLSECEPSEQQKTNLQEIASHCRKLLSELEELLSKYSELKASQDTIGKKVKRVWKRLKWEPEDIQELRARLTSNIALLDAFIGQISSQATFAAKKGIDRLNEHQDSHERLTILDWITPVDYAPQQSDFINRRQANTGQWFLDSSEFGSWLTSEKDVLFSPGIPGAGKTILSSIVIDELTNRFGNDETVGIAYVYCNFRRKHEQRVEDLLASLLKQLAQGRLSLPESVKVLYDKHKDQRTRPSLDDIAKVLQSVTALYTKTFVIVDAIDECQTSDGCQSRFLAELFNLKDNYCVNLFATSRFIPEITERFDLFTRLEIRASPEDVQRYVDGQILNLPSFVRRSPELREEIAAAIVQAVDGMFLLAQLHLESLTKKRSPKAVRAALAKLPSGSEAYDHAYKNAMERIEAQGLDQEELAKQTLSWITCAERPLTTTELQHALAVVVGEPELDEENLSDLEDIVSACAGLVTIDEQSEIIRLVHYTTQEYFKRMRKHWFPDADTYTTETCVTYLAFDVFESGSCESDSEFEERLRLYPLYSYAACYWGHHARQMPTLSQRIMDFLHCMDKIQASVQALIVSKIWPGQSNYSQGCPSQMTGLHLASYHGVEKAVQALAQTENVNSRNNFCQTPLRYAAEHGYEAIVQLLLDAGAVADPKDHSSRTPLSWAADEGHEATVRLLLDTGKVETDSREANGRTPLWLAARSGHEAIVRLLLGAGAEPDLHDNSTRTPLSKAAGKGHEAIVRLLLDIDKVKADSKDKRGQTPLAYAAENGYEAIVQFLLDTGKVEADSKDNHGRTPLSWAAEQGHEAIIRLLLGTEKVEADLRDNYGQTPLSYAAGNGYEAIVQFLLDTGKVEADSKDNHGRTPLSWAAEQGHEAILRLLLGTEKVETDSKDNYGRTPLSWAAEFGHEAVVRLLLATEKVETDSKDQDGQTPLSLAAEYGHKALVRLLLDTGKVEADSRDKNGLAPLSYAAIQGDEGVVQLLLDAGAEADLKDEDGRTPLSYAASYEYEELVRLLLDTGKVNASSEDEKGRTPSWYAAKQGHEAIVKLLEARS